MITVFGSINLDLIFPLASIPVSGETLLAEAALLMPGGKGANQAVAAACDGGTVAMVGAVGRDALAEPALALMLNAGVDVSRVRRVDAATGVAAILVDRAGDNAIAVGSGANLLARAEDVQDRLLGPGNTLVVQMEVDAGETAALIRRARRAGGRILLNLAPAGVIARDALAMVDWLVVNEAEALWLASQLGTASGAAALRGRLGVDVVRTLGAGGVEIATTDGFFEFAAHPVTALDTTGAGDCFVGVVAACLQRGASLSDAVQRGCVAAAICCTQAGSQASLPWAAETDREMPRRHDPDVGH